MGQPDERFRQLQDEISEQMALRHVPGVAVGILDGERVHAAGLGVTNVDHPLPVDADTLFQIGSTTKTITATAVMRLVEAGKLDLDIPVRAYVPELRLADASVVEHVTLRHLFTHTGGWEGDYFADTGAGDDALARMAAQLHETPQIAPLGELFSYNNAGFYIAGRVIEVITGQPYEQAVRELVLTPLDMQQSFFFAADAITHAVSAGHLVRDEQPQVALPWGLPRSANPVGGLISSTHDQLRYARFHLGDGMGAGGKRLLSSETMALMQAPHGPGGNDITAMGIAWRLQDIAGTRIVGHGGATNGQMSAFLLVPELHWAITVLTNADRGAELHRVITRRAMELFLGLKAPAEPSVTLAPEMLAAYAGRYMNSVTAVTVTLEGDNLHLYAEDRGGFPRKGDPPISPPEEGRFATLGDDRILGLDDPFAGAHGEFLRDAAGQIVWLRLGGRLLARQAESAAQKLSV